ncbi:MAG: hypothetical protein OM95_04635 [Bdellovibrio sp. ArHS]|uniref:flavin monoamine oxidase family protein n=1 Tax=Bdellovibrio sp. ArHS TaxID=1569284 RepID=UPI000583F350|nr:NAD(P)/FAD-dependent oxidoreductase [Bdellovibrio sp. ArHS]KHD89119.1 MAG: hypothetical protein OM95_04635 [Bdellovibrio sp. ArHS]
MPTNKKYDVIIVGAGAAGLTCARQLLRAGKKVCLVEARERVGGRIYSQPHHIEPIELGAEFLHGTPQLLLQLIEEQNGTFVTAPEEHLFLQGRSLIPLKNFEKEFAKISKRLNRNPKTDRSVADFLKTLKDTPTEYRQSFVAYVEGFQGADLELIGEKSLALAESQDEGTIGEDGAFRPLQRYAGFFENMLGPHLHKILHLQHVAKRIEWSKQGVVVSTISKGRRKIAFHGKHVVLTVPLAVLQNNQPTSRIEFVPPLVEVGNTLNGLHMGHVQRIVFEFKDRFWETLSQGPVVFMRAGPEYYFPTWWTKKPIHNTILVAWQGGPKAWEMATWSEKDRVHQALTTLSALTGKSRSFLLDHLKNYYTYNWSRDPFSLGAYSYTGVERTKSRRRITMPIQGRIWLAGEAFAKHSAQGTVHGAMQTGQRVAMSLLKRL